VRTRRDCIPFFLLMYAISFTSAVTLDSPACLLACSASSILHMCCCAQPTAIVKIKRGTSQQTEHVSVIVCRFSFDLKVTQQTEHAQHGSASIQARSLRICIICCGTDVSLLLLRYKPFSCLRFPISLGTDVSLLLPKFNPFSCSRLRYFLGH
jgi:hypothetical protein